MNVSIKLSAMYHRLITIALLGIAVAIRDVSSIDRPEFFAPPISGAPAINDPSSNFSTAPQINIPVGPPKLLESYLAPVMQALAYHIELLQYEPLSTSTIEPPFEGSATLITSSTTVSPFGQWPSTQKPPTASTPWWQQSTSSIAATATSTPWWQPSTSSEPSAIVSTATSTPWWQKPSSSTTPSSTAWWQKPSTSTIFSTTTPSTSVISTTTSIPWWQKPSSTTHSSTAWWQKPSTSTFSSTTTPSTTLTTTTQKPSSLVWWSPSTSTSATPATLSTPVPWWQTSTHPTTSTQGTSTAWWQTSSKPSLASTQATSSPWWQQSSTQKPISFITTTTTRKPWWETSSTSGPSSTSAPWWQTTTNKPSSSSWIQQLSTTLKPSSSTQWWQPTTKPTTAIPWWQTTPKPASNPTQSISWWPTTQKPATYKPPSISWFSSTSTTKKPWWEPNTTTRKPASTSIWWIPFSTVTSTTQRPWWQESSTQSKPPAISWTTTTKPHSQWWTTTKPPVTWWSASKPSTAWWLAAKPTASWFSTVKPSTSWWTATRPSTQWWQKSSTKPPTNYWWQSSTKPWWEETTKTTTPKPWWYTTTTKKLPTFISWESPIWNLSNGKPASKPALHTTDDSGVQETTPSHLPGNIPPSPLPNAIDSNDPFLGHENNIEYEAQANEVHPVSAVAPAASSTANNAPSTTRKNHDWPFEMPSLAGDTNFIDWLLQGKSKDTPNDSGYDFSRLDPLPSSLIHDILAEKSELPALRDVDNVNEFRRIYDDSYGRSRQTSGKKRVPPTKPYVEFLMLYDLLKREAKALNLTMYEGYSEQMIQNLASTSKRSSEVQLHILITRLLEQGEVTRSDVTTRLKLILKDLENPNSVTAKSLHLIPPLQFVP